MTLQNFFVNIFYKFFYLFIGTKKGIVSIDETTNNVRPKLPNSVVIANDGAMYWTDTDTHYGSNDDLYLVFADGLGRYMKINCI